MESLPESFTFEIVRTGFAAYRLTASQVLPVDRETAFGFFRDPRNLCDITPVWLDFCMLDKDSNTDVYENAEFDYTIKWLGIRMGWRSRIVDYQPPEQFTDTQIKGPYRSWTHLHTFEQVPGGTLMKDRVTYKPPLPALPVHRHVIRKNLKDIFSYRAARIEEWADKVRDRQ